MAANQTQVPVIQSETPGVTQLQQNSNKVFRNINNQLSDLTASVSELFVIGEIKFAHLTLAQFQAQAGEDWILANGQTAIGTTYAQLTKNNTVPNITLTGTTAFIKVN